MAKILIFLLILPLKLSFAVELATGDILLQPLDCWSCTLIEQQESSEFSHMGMVIRQGEELFVLEAYGQVQLTRLQHFQKRTASKSRIKVMRLKNYNSQSELSLIAQAKKFIGHPYDAMFLWDNYIKGKEAFYCSELIYKLLKSFYHFEDLTTKPMLFDVNAHLWDLYFSSKTPRYQYGLSPEDFHLSRDFEVIGDL